MGVDYIKSNNDRAGLNVLQAEAVDIIGHIVEGKYHVGLFRDQPTGWLMLTPPIVDDEDPEWAKPFRIDEFGTVFPQNDPDEDGNRSDVEGQTFSAFEFGAFLLSYPTVFPTDQPNEQDEEYVNTAVTVLMVQRNNPSMPPRIIISALRRAARQRNLLPDSE